jgi:hypothetical protein
MPGEQETDEYLSAVINSLPEGQAGQGYEFWNAPDLLVEIREGKLRLGQLFGTYEAEEFRSLLAGLIGLFIRRLAGEDRARWQLNVVQKFVYPQKFEVPWTLVESLAGKYESGHLVRGWALRRLMYELAGLVELRQPEREDITASVVFISPDADQGHRLYPLVRRYCKPKTTLQSLAIRVYLELIQGENEEGVIDERSLRRDLKRLKAWEDADPMHTRLKREYAAAGQYHWKARIPVRLYSESFRPPTPSELTESALNSSRSEVETGSGK